MPDEKAPLRVFICHAPGDARKARLLYRYLKRRGVDAWLDEIDLLPGQAWDAEIEKAAYDASAAIICLSKVAVEQEGHIQKEIKQTLEISKEKTEDSIYVIPVLLEKCDVPHSLKNFHPVSLFAKDGHAKLMKTLNKQTAKLELSHIPSSPKIETLTNVFDYLVGLLEEHPRPFLVVILALIFALALWSIPTITAALWGQSKVEIILDVSKRMSAEFDQPGKIKFDVAKDGVLQLLNNLEGSNSLVALRLIYSDETDECNLPDTSLVVDFTRDYDQIRKIVRGIQISAAPDAPLVGVIEQAFDDYRQSNIFNRNFSIFTFSAGDDTCGRKLDLFLRSQNESVITNLFLVIMLGKEPEPPWGKSPYVSPDFVHTAQQVQEAVEKNSEKIKPPPTFTPEPSSTNTPTLTQTIEYTSIAPTEISPTPIIPITGPGPTATMKSKPKPTNDTMPPLLEPANLPTEAPASPIEESTSTKASSPTLTKTVTKTLTKTLTLTPLVTKTSTRTKTPPPIPTGTDTATWTPNPTSTYTSIPTFTDTDTPMPTSTDTDIPTPTSTLTLAPTATPTSVVEWTPLPSSLKTDVFSTGCPLISTARVFAQFSQNQASISANIVPGGYSNAGLRLDYFNIYNLAGNYAGWEIWLGDDDQSGINLSAYNSLVFYIRGNVGSEEPNVYLMMPIMNENYQRFWKDVELVKPVTTSWQQVIIPLSHFTSSQAPHEQVDLSNIQRIQVLFEWYPQPMSGTIFIDDLCVR